jgi:hypothetical protein
MAVAASSEVVDCVGHERDAVRQDHHRKLEQRRHEEGDEGPFHRPQPAGCRRDRRIHDAVDVPVARSTGSLVRVHAVTVSCVVTVVSLDHWMLT